jgi:biotin carboxyl carrier protein
VSEPAITPLGDGVFLVVSDSGRQIAYATVAGDRCWVHLNGRVHVIAASGTSSSRAATRGDDDLALASPMPATVIEIRVAKGQAVSRGDVLVMLEAMKMELPIRAPRDGRVASVACQPGELVQPGVPLLELE